MIFTSHCRIWLVMILVMQPLLYLPKYLDGKTNVSDWYPKIIIFVFSWKVTKKMLMHEGHILWTYGDGTLTEKYKISTICAQRMSMTKTTLAHNIKWQTFDQKPDIAYGLGWQWVVIKHTSSFVQARNIVLPMKMYLHTNVSDQNDEILINRSSTKLLEHIVKIIK